MAENKNEATLLIKIKQAGAEILDRLVITVADIQQAFKKAWDVIVGSIDRALDAYEEQEKAINTLNTAMVNAGIYTKKLSDEYIANADALSKTTDFADEAIVSAQAQLQQMLGNMKVTKELTLATLNLATRTGSLDSAAMMIGKTIATNTNLLQRQGIEIGDVTDKNKKMQLVIAGIEKQLHGQAEAQVKGLGVFHLLSKATGELSEALGGQLAPIFEVIGHAMLNIVEKYGQPLVVFFGTHLRQTFAEVAMIATGLQYLFEQVGQVIGNTLGFIAEALSHPLNFTKIKQDFKTLQETMAAESLEITGRAAKQKADIEAAYMDDQKEKLEESLSMEQEARDKAVEIARQKKLEAQVKDREDQIAAMEMQNQLIGADQEKALEIAQANLDKKIAQESDAHTKLQLLNAKAAMQNQQNLIKQKEYEDKIQAEKLKGYSTFFGGVASLQNAHNKTLAAAGKAAAISQATIDAYLAIQNALAHIPAPANIAAAAGIGVQAFANVARISGVQLAEGGVVMPSPGGTQATIGEGGQPEMVLPLDKAQSAGFGGGGTTVIFNGPIMGNEAQAEEFARAIDRQLLKLRQSNQSVAFETDVI